MTEHLPEFLVVATLVIVTPGQDTVLTLRNTLLGGRGRGVATAFGVGAGQLAWALATSVGAAAVLQTSELAFAALRVAGMAYLLWLGGHALLRALRGGAPAVARTLGTLHARGAWRQGFVSNLSNPKMAVFFPSLLPQFVPAGADFFPVALALGALFSGMTISWLCAYAAVVARAGDVLRRAGVRRLVDALTGVVLVGLGLRLATDSR